MSDLNVLRLGDSGPHLVFLHGLFGQGRNWMSIAKAFADSHRITLVDLPNHGRSSWTEHVDYLDMAAEVAALLESDGAATVVGHSMGGKVAMVLALTRPELVQRLVVADMSPVDYRDEAEATGGVLGYARILLDVDLAQVDRREDADRLLAGPVPNTTVRSFLLQNLRRDAGVPNGWRWAANLEAVVRDGARLAGWPEEALAGLAPYAGRVLWLAGELSSYVQPAYDDAMRRWFPHYRKVTLKGAGHWLHSEKPDIFVAALSRFLAR